MKQQECPCCWRKIGVTKQVEREGKLVAVCLWCAENNEPIRNVKERQPREGRK